MQTQNEKVKSSGNSGNLQNSPVFHAFHAGNPDMIVVDTETTGISKSDEVIELGWIAYPSLQEMTANLYRTKPLAQYSQRFKPSCVIGDGARKVHGISHEMVADCPDSAEILSHLPIGFQTQSKAPLYVIGFNLSFDLRMIEQSHRLPTQSSIAPICVYSLACKLLTEQEVESIPNKKLVSLAHHFFPHLAEQIKSESHSAIGDCALTIMVLSKLVQRTTALSWADLAKIAEPTAAIRKAKAAQEVTTMPLGKWKGTAIADVPRNYLQWAVDNMSFYGANGKALKASIEKVLGTPARRG